jgi:hypothetical protein
VTHGWYLACGRQAKTHHRKQRTGHSQLAVILEIYSYETSKLIVKHWGGSATRSAGAARLHRDRGELTVGGSYRGKKAM